MELRSRELKPGKVWGGGALQIPGTTLGTEWVTDRILWYLVCYLRGSGPFQRVWGGHNDQTETQGSLALCHASLKLSEFRIGGEERPSLMPAIPRGTSATDPGLPFSWLITVVPLLQMCGLFYICRNSGQGSLSVVLLFFRVACVRSNPKLPFSQPPNQKQKTKHKLCL